MLFLCGDNHGCVLCKKSTDVVQIIALILLYLSGASQQLVNFEGLWAAGVGRSCAKPAEGVWAEQPQQWHREGEELQFPPWLTCFTVWVAVAGDRLLLGVG